MSKSVRVVLLVVMSFGLICSCAYADLEGEVEYANFDYIHFYYTYSEKEEELTEAQLQEWVSDQGQAYLEKDVLVISEGFVYDVKKDGDYYEVEISHITGSFAEPHLFLKNLSPEVALSLKKNSKIKFEGKVTEFFLGKREALNIEFDNVEIRRY